MQQVLQEEERQYNARESEIKNKYNILDYPIFPKLKKKIEYKRQLLRKVKNELDAKSDEIKQTELFINKSLKKLNEDKTNIDMEMNSNWTLTVCFYLIGICLGAFQSKFIGDKIGRKNAILLHYVFSFLAVFLIFSSLLIDMKYFSPALIKFAEFINGFQGGLGVTMAICYLNEIAPDKIRGEMGMMAPLQFILGVITSQIIGFNLVLGILMIIIFKRIK